MHIALLIAAFLAILLIFLYTKKEKITPLSEFTRSCNTLLDDNRATSDVAFVVESVIDVVDKRSSDFYQNLNAKLNTLYREAEKTQCFSPLRSEINAVFASADKVLRQYVKHRGA